MSYNIVKQHGGGITEGINFIQNQYPYYDKDKLFDRYNNEQYSVQMILKSISGLISDKSEIFKLIIFDALIGNSDRHHSNWGLKPMIKDDKDTFWIYLGLCPLYDNGSSLCAYVNESEINQILNDNMRFESLVNTKSKSAIGWKATRPIRHFDLIKELQANYYDLTEKYVKIVKENITDENINNILNEFDNNIISLDMKKLLFKFIIERKNRILEIYNMKDEV